MKVAWYTMSAKILFYGHIVSVVFLWLFRRHQVKRGDWVENKQRGNFGLVFEVDQTRRGLLVNFMNHRPASITRNGST